MSEMVNEGRSEILAIKRAFKQLQPLDAAGRQRAMIYLMDALVTHPTKPLDTPLGEAAMARAAE
jgi:hypothetical protein